MVIKTCVKGIGFAEEAFTYTGIRIYKDTTDKNWRSLAMTLFDNCCNSVFIS